MKRFLGILIALLLVFSGVVFAQQQSTKTLDDIDARIAALGTLSWAAYGYYSWVAYPLNTAVGSTISATPETIYKNLWYLGRNYNIYGYIALNIKWSGVTLANTLYFDQPGNVGLYNYSGFVGFLHSTHKITFAKDNISVWGELINDYSNGTLTIGQKYEIYDVGFTISKVFDIISLRIGGYGRVTIREFSPVYPNRLFANGTGDFRDRGIAGSFNAGTPTWVRVASTFSLLDNSLNIYLWTRFYNAVTNIADYLGNAQNITLGVKYTLQDIGIIRFNIQQGFAIKRENAPYLAGYFWNNPNSPAGFYVAKFAPTNKYFVEFRLVAVENLDLLVTAQLDIANRINRNPAAITGAGTVNDPFILQYKNTMKIDAGIDALYVLGETMDIGIHLGFNTISGMNYLELTGNNWTTPAVGGNIAYVGANYTEANYIQKTYAGDLFNAGLYFNYYLDKFTFSVKVTFRMLGWDLDDLSDTGTMEFYGYGSTIFPSLTITYAVSKQSAIYLGLSYYIYTGVPAYNSNWETNYNMKAADWKNYVDNILGPYFVINVDYEVSF